MIKDNMSNKSLSPDFDFDFESGFEFGFESDFESGFGLIEVLIALVVISVGLLGLATLNTTAYRLSIESQWRMTAMYLAESMANRMKMNFAELKTPPPYTSAYSGLGVANNCTSSASPCTPRKMAEFDVYEMKQQASKLLPSGNIVISGGGMGSVITVTWKGKDNASRSFSTFAIY